VTKPFDVLCVVRVSSHLLTSVLMSRMMCWMYIAQNEDQVTPAHVAIKEKSLSLSTANSWNSVRSTLFC